MKKDDTHFSRRKFLRNSTVVAVSMSLPGFVACGDNEPESDSKENECLTTTDILGPFYKAGAPFSEDIRPSDNKGAPLIIEGKVYTDCNTILKDAIVEIWNADTGGEYDTSDAFRFRGRYKTLVDGVYRFKTIIPGRYLNGATFRPSHIHFRVTAPHHQELISQIYFKDDPFIKNDPWAGSKNASERILTVGHDGNGTDTVNFNIYLMQNK